MDYIIHNIFLDFRMRNPKMYFGLDNLKMYSQNIIQNMFLDCLIYFTLICNTFLDYVIWNNFLVLDCTIEIDF